MAEESKQIYGGQAVIEGVMFGGREYTVTAVRRKDKSIEFYRLPRVRNKALSLLKKFHFYEVLPLLWMQVRMERNI